MVDSARMQTVWLDRADLIYISAYSFVHTSYLTARIESARLPPLNRMKMNSRGRRSDLFN